ncbi:MAG: helix-hairpin-helix domain-containing protein [Steroidobacteraceae bacterium]|nr:helix-hairpin-helix domain-containing protein [Nevskiaceae bacterium]MCP5359943.1 helix-hairpin-helix domain-containing protein [Nevskiaceae bacterium]MCP5472238.1 helix-hairpin-helix domain-containing protein [Nevskiaceae bacterium]
MKLIPCLLASLPLLLPVPGLADPVNINTADAATLARELKGVGEARARAIVEHRSQHGPFRSADELVLVRGIGQKVVDQNRANIRVDRPAKAAAAAASTPAAAARPAAAAAPSSRPVAPARPAAAR